MLLSHLTREVRVGLGRKAEKEHPVRERTMSLGGVRGPETEAGRMAGRPVDANQFQNVGILMQ